MGLRYLLDTNICIYIAKHKPHAVLKRFEQLMVGDAAISVITWGELCYGAHKSNQPQKNRALLQQLASLIPPMPMSTEVGKYYGKIRHTLETKGKIIGNNDLWIAAHALELGVTLVTNNTHEFSRVSDLEIENWV